MKHDKDEGSETYGKAGNIDNGIGFLPCEIPKGDEQVVLEHFDSF